MWEIICARLLPTLRAKSARVMKGSLGASERGAPNKQAFVAHMGECREPVSGAGQFL